MMRHHIDNVFKVCSPYLSSISLHSSLSSSIVSRYGLLTIFTLLALLSFVMIDANAATLRVPSDYDTIQAAIDDASDGDEIVVADGIYTGSGNKNIDLLGKAITVRSENGPENCIIDCENNGRGFFVHRGEGLDSVVKGFSIVNGSTAGKFPDNNGGGILCYSASPTITG
ncbi:MAG: hypothetical protein ACE5PV_20475, partial [Candidatus Poribacteria bacterium]